MTENNEHLDSHRERVLDRALAEIVGGEAPPDLTEGILERLLSKATHHKDKTVAEPAIGRTTSRTRYALALAASVLILAGGTYFLLPAINGARESARRASDGNDGLTTGQTATGENASTFISYGALLNDAHADADGRIRRQLPVGELYMMVAPRIIIQEEEEQRLHGFGESQVPDITADLEHSARREGPLDGKGEGRGPGQGGDQYTRIVENPFLAVAENPLSTFSIDVDTASYANMRQYLTQVRQLPPPDSVRIEELVNYFGYDYEAPTSEGGPPFTANMEVTACPWQPKHRLLRIGLKGREIPNDERPPSNLVFLVDVSGSMDKPNKLPLVVQGLKTLAEHLGENDRVAIVVYASAEGLVLDSTPGTERYEILDVLDRLRAGGSTNGGAGIELAYRIATDNLIQNGTNRVILCTDGDFNVGATSHAALERIVEEKAKTGVFLTVLGFGRGNLNDQMMETISNCGNGNYHYVDGAREVQKVLVEEMGGTLVTIAKDVKIQIEFNPTSVASYRLIGYENRILAKEDFNDDTKDAGEIGAGHTVTALYELVPPGEPIPPGVDPLKYQKTPETTDAAAAGELLTLKLRYKEPNGETSKLLSFTLVDEGYSFGEASKETKFAASVAMLGMLLRNSQHDGNSTYDAAIEIATEGVGHDDGGYRAEFVDLIRQAEKLSGKR